MTTRSPWPSGNRMLSPPPRGRRRAGAARRTTRSRPSCRCGAAAADGVAVPGDAVAAVAVEAQPAVTNGSPSSAAVVLVEPVAGLGRARGGAAARRPAYERSSRGTSTTRSYIWRRSARHGRRRAAPRSTVVGAGHPAGQEVDPGAVGRAACARGRRTAKRQTSSARAVSKSVARKSTGLRSYDEMSNKCSTCWTGRCQAWLSRDFSICSTVSSASLSSLPRRTSGRHQAERKDEVGQVGPVGDLGGRARHRTARSSWCRAWWRSCSSPGTGPGPGARARGSRRRGPSCGR